MVGKAYWIFIVFVVLAFTCCVLGQEHVEVENIAVEGSPESGKV